METVRKGKENCSELAGGSSYGGVRVTGSRLYISMLLSLSSTLVQSAFSSKTHFDLKTDTYLFSAEGRKRIKMKTMTENIAAACVFSIRKEFSNILMWTVKRHQNGSVDANRFMRFL